MKRGGFTLRKWISNNPLALKVLNAELKGTTRVISLTEDQTVKLLGIIWDPVQDSFSVHISNVPKVNTKRELLSSIAKIFDPLGFLSPATVFAKILMQESWALKCAWDDPLPPDVLNKWTKFSSQLPLLTNMKIPRFALCENSSNHQIHLHGFCDASPRAYAAVLYLQIIKPEGQVKVTLLAAKTRVAPLKVVSLPRLELSAALLLSQLYSTITTLDIKPHQVHFWTDSQITLDWIRSESRKWKTYVSNRIAKVHQLTAKESWHHVPTGENPADCASRGIMPSKLIDHPLWWTGPTWLTVQPFSVPDSQETQVPDSSEEEIEVTSFATVLPATPEILLKYSSFTQLLRIFTWCLRFINNCRISKPLREVHHLQSAELESALLHIVKILQDAHFSSEIHELKTKGHLPPNSAFLQLNVFLDENEVLRVGGRLRNAQVSEQQKHPVLLPRNHYVTELIIDYFHKKSLHGGTQLVLSLFRQQFWITSARNKIRAQLRKCITCFRLKSHKPAQLMGDLPRDRVTPARPYQKVGIDFAGPIITKPNLARTRVKIKSYIALFICFCTKAVHLELVSDLTTESFLAALRRFTSRRGVPSDIYSDNATNFQGARNYLKTQQQLLHTEAVQGFTSEHRITWHFIPPLSPHFGGLWEANVKSIKNHMVKTCKSAILSFEELSTLLAQIEAVLNSRPLTHLSVDPEDFQPLTPGHFLIGSPLLAFPETTSDDTMSLRSRWTLVQRLRTSFWNRWSREYLTQLQVRTKWKTSKPNLTEGQLVLLKDEHTHPMKWILGRIVALHTGDDGCTRVVDVRTPAGVFRRPIVKVCPLPLQD